MEADLAARRRARRAAHTLHARIRAYLRWAIRGDAHVNASARLMKDVGYSGADAHAHFQRMLGPGQTVEAVLAAGWHIDHIVPCATYDLDNAEDVRRCWCLSNLRLLPASKNIRKGAKREVLL